MEENDGTMGTVLRRVALVMGIVLLGISIYWSQNGFNFEVAGDSGGTKMAVYVGYILAIAVTVVQFVFSTSLSKLNTSLIVFGFVAYGYSIYTNYVGIIDFQGEKTNDIMAWVLAFAMDGVPEPLIAWGLGESLAGDFVGNVFGAIGRFFVPKPKGKPQQSQKPQQGQGQKPHQEQGTQPRPQQTQVIQKLAAQHRAQQFRQMEQQAKQTENRPNRFDLQ